MTAKIIIISIIVSVISYMYVSVLCEQVDFYVIQSHVLYRLLKWNQTINHCPTDFFSAHVDFTITVV